MTSLGDGFLENCHLLTQELDIVVEVVILVVEARLHSIKVVLDSFLCKPMCTSCDGFLFTLKGWFLSSICLTVPRHDSQYKYGYGVIWWVDTTTLSHLPESIGLMIRAEGKPKSEHTQLTQSFEVDRLGLWNPKNRSNEMYVVARGEIPKVKMSKARSKMTEQKWNTHVENNVVSAAIGK